MRQLGENVLAVVAGVAIGTLAGYLTFAGILSGEGGADAAIAALIVGPVVMAEVTVGAIATLVLLANGRRHDASFAGAALALVLLAEYAWLSS
jgi:ABC-type spermidine/putrescine transport system permease subunit II